MDQVRQQGERERAHMASEHKHELLKLRTQLERLDGRNSNLKEKLMDYQRVHIIEIFNCSQTKFVAIILVLSVF